MAFGYLCAVLLVAAVAVFSLQNSAQTSVRFLVWTLGGLPLAAVALASLAVGLVVAGLPLWIRSWRWRSPARSAETRVAMLERARADQDDAAAAPARAAGIRAADPLPARLTGPPDSVQRRLSPPATALLDQGPGGRPKSE